MSLERTLLIALLKESMLSPPSGPVVWTAEKAQAVEERAAHLADRIIQMIGLSA